MTKQKKEQKEKDKEQEDSKEYLPELPAVSITRSRLNTDGITVDIFKFSASE